MAELKSRVYDAIIARAKSALPVRVCFQYDSFSGAVTEDNGKLMFMALGMKSVNLSFVFDMRDVRSVSISDNAFTIYMNVDFEDGAHLPFH